MSKPTSTSHHIRLLIISILSALMVSTQAFAQTPIHALQSDNNATRYVGHLDLGSYYRYLGRQAMGEVDLFMPLWQSTGQSLVFLDMRGLDSQGPQIEGNFGLGYRQITPNQLWMWGLYGFFDVQQTAARNTWFCRICP